MLRFGGWCFFVREFESVTNESLADVLGIVSPWLVRGWRVDHARGEVVVLVDFERGTRFEHERAAGFHPVHDTRRAVYRHRDGWGWRCWLDVRLPRVRLPDGKVVMVRPPWQGLLGRETLAFEAEVFRRCLESPFAVVARQLGLTWHKARAVAVAYVERALPCRDLSGVRRVLVDETSFRKGHRYLTVVVDGDTGEVLFVTEGRSGDALGRFAEFLRTCGGDPLLVGEVCIDMSRAFIAGVREHLPSARVTYDKYHVVAQASGALEETRRGEVKLDESLRGMRWALLKEGGSLTEGQRSQLDALLRVSPGALTVRAWRYVGLLREVLRQTDPAVARAGLRQWCTNVNRSRVEAMKRVSRLIMEHLDGVAAWAETRLTNGFIEALNGVFQAVKRMARGYALISTVQVVLYMRKGGLDFSRINPYLSPPVRGGPAV